MFPSRAWRYACALCCLAYFVPYYCLYGGMPVCAAFVLRKTGSRTCQPLCGMVPRTFLAALSASRQRRVPTRLRARFSRLPHSHYSTLPPTAPLFPIDSILIPVLLVGSFTAFYWIIIIRSSLLLVGSLVRFSWFGSVGSGSDFSRSALARLFVPTFLRFVVCYVTFFPPPFAPRCPLRHRAC